MKDGRIKKIIVLFLLLIATTYPLNKNLARIKFVMPDDEDKQTYTTKPNNYNQITSNDTISPDLARQGVIGYTTYDRQYNGPVYSHCRVDPVAYGIHCYWMYSNFAPATDRNQRYNFYDFATRTWNWIDGVNVYTTRSGFGGMDYDPITGCAVTSTHQGSGTTIRPVVARDQAPGTGLFEYCPGPFGFRWPAVAVTQNQAIHIAMIDTTSQYNLYYLRVSPWGTSSTPMLILPSPRYPSHNIAASKISNKLIILWVEMIPESAYHNAYYKISNDGGINWQPAVQLPFPPAFSGIDSTAPSFNLASLFACFDNNDNFHIVASVNAVHNDSFATITPAEIWHYCPVNSPSWSFIFRYDPYYFQYIGYNAIIADRPSIVQDPTTLYFYVTWEVFDSLNYEPLTALARADIYLAELRNNGQLLSQRQRITSPNTTSKRFPCIGGVRNDTIFIQYLIDSITGFEIYSQGRATRNPIVVHRRHRNEYSVEEELAPEKFYNLSLSPATPNPFSSHATIRYSLPDQSNISLEIYDVSGRLVKTLVDELKSSSVYTATWNGRNNTGYEVKSGIYFCTLKTNNKSITNKLIKTK